MKKKGFTLIELLVVVGVIGILATIVLTSLGGARNKSKEASVKSNLKNAILQGEMFYNTNSVSNNTYTGVCTNGDVGGAEGVGSMVLAAAKSIGIDTYSINGSSPLVSAVCNDSASAWAAQVPLLDLGDPITGTIPCTNVVWGDPDSGFGKVCEYYNSASGWVQCGTENTTCTYPTNIDSLQIRYGHVLHNKFYYKNFGTILWCVDSTGESKAGAIGEGTACL